MPRKARTDVIGKTFGRLFVTGITETTGKRRRMAVASCSCGNKIVTEIYSLEAGRTKSCGCSKTRHGHAADGKTSRTYNSWAMMHDRCRNPNDDRYPRYGGRGIKVCERWGLFENFLADMGERPISMSIDRIDTDGDYTPENCRWATNTEQMRNRSVSILVSFGREVMTLKECCRIVGEDYQRARKRVKVHGWPPIYAVLGELVAYG